MKHFPWRKVAVVLVLAGLVGGALGASLFAYYASILPRPERFGELFSEQPTHPHEYWILTILSHFYPCKHV